MNTFLDRKHALTLQVETPAQLAHLKASGCDIFQGYFFSKPLPEGLLLPWASQRSQEHAP